MLTIKWLTDFLLLSLIVTYGDCFWCLGTGYATVFARYIFVYFVAAVEHIPVLQDGL